MLDSFDPGQHYWLLPDGRIWSARDAKYVDLPVADYAFGVTPVASLGELREILDRLVPEQGPAVMTTADDVRAEASRRMQALVGARNAEHLSIILSNGSREAIKLLRIKSERAWTKAEAKRAAQLEGLEAAIDAIRAASNELEAVPPADYADDKYWP